METAFEHPSLYRFGFLLTGHDDPIRERPNDNWRHERHGDFQLLLHQDTEVRSFENTHGSALLLGWAFPIGETSIGEAVERIIAAPQTEIARELYALSGRFCIVVRSDGGTRLITDPFGARTIFYSDSQAGTIASHAELLARHVGARMSEPALTFRTSEGFKGLSVKYLPGDTTMYADIRCSVPNHALRLETVTLERIWPSQVRKTCSLEAFFNRCDVYFASLARGLGRRPVFLGLTGGIDTRFLLAGLARHRLDLRGMTWLGGYHDPRERPIIEEIAARMGISNTYVETPGPRCDVSDVGGRNGGNARGSSRLTSAVDAAFPEIGPAIFVRGYGGEILRGFYNLQSEPMRDGSPQEMLRVYAAKSRAETLGPLFEQFAGEAFAEFANRGGYGERLAALGYDPNDLFYWEQRMGNWAAGMLNEMDPAMFSVAGLNDRLLYDLAFGLDPKLRLSKRLFTRYIERVEPRLSGLPIV